MATKAKAGVKWAQISAFRLARHNLLAESQKELVAVSREVCGIQAQMMASAHMAVWARAHHLRPSDITSALCETRCLVKTLCMRRTLHLIPSDEFQVYISALKASRMAAILRIMSRFGITERDVDNMNQMVVAEINSEPTTKGELNARIRPRMSPKIKAWMDRVSSPFSPALTEGLICYGPYRGNETTYVRVDKWLPRQSAVSVPDAKRILFRRYLSAYGPATVQDLAYWSGMSMKEARQIPELLGGELTEVKAVDKTALVLAADYDALVGSRLSGGSVFLLPGFDPYLLGHADKTPILRPEYYKRVYRNQGWISPVILLDGEVVAVWSSKRASKVLSLEVHPFRKLPKKVRDFIQKQAASLGSFLGTAVEVAFIE
jgi:hypothetical protein